MNDKTAEQAMDAALKALRQNCIPGTQSTGEALTAHLRGADWARSS